MSVAPATGTKRRSLAAVPDDHIFVDYVLRSALTAPGAATDPVAGRFLARLFATVAVEAGEHQITSYLAPTPQSEATFEVRVFQAGNLTPRTITSDLDAIAAIRMAHRMSHEQNEGVEVLSRVPQLDRDWRDSPGVDSPGLSDVERCVFVRDSTGELEYRFAGAETLLGEPEACAQAQRAWAVTLNEWAAWVARERGREPGTPTASVAIASASFATGSSGSVAAVSSAAGSFAPGSAGSFAPGSAGSFAPGSFDDPDLAAAPPAPSVVGSTGLAVTPDEPVAGAGLIKTLERFFSNLAVEVDLGQIEQLVRQAVDRDRKENIEPLAARVAELLRESIPPSTALTAARAEAERRDLVPSAPVIVGVPTAAEVAEVVSAQVGALLSETILSRRYGEAGGQHSALQVLHTAVDQMDVRLDGLRDEIRRSTTLLTELSEHLEVADRRAAIAERITTSVDQEMQRLANRIDDQVSALTSSAGGGSELSDGVARLTRKLRQSVAELDRALLRLNQVIDQVGGVADDRVAVGRGSLPVVPPRRPGLPGPPSPVSPVVRR